MIYRASIFKKVTKDEYFKLWDKVVREIGSEIFANLIFKGRRNFKDSFNKDHIPSGIGLLESIKEYSKLAEKATDDDYDYFIEDGYENVFIGGEEAIEEYKKLFNLE